MAEKSPERALQEKVLAYRVLESKLDTLVKQRDFIVSKIVESKTTMVSIDEIKKGKNDIIFPLGSSAYATAKSVSKDKILAEVGGGVVMEKTPEDAKKLLNRRVVDLQSALSTLNKEVNKVSSAMEELAPEIQKIVESAQRGKSATQAG